MRTAIVRQIADGLLQMSMDIATEKMMGLWVDCAKWITEETLGTQTQVDGVLNAWANLTVQDACKRPIKTQKRRYEKASCYVEKAEAIQAWRDVTLVHLYAAQNAFEGFGDEMDNSDMIREIKGHIYDLLEYDEMEFNIARQVDKARSTIRQEAWNSIVPVEIYWDSESADLDFDVRADLPYGDVVLYELTGSFNKTNGFSVVVTEFMQPGYRFMGVAESESPVEILISVSDEMAGTVGLYDFDISLSVNYEEIDNPMQYIEYTSDGDYLKLVFKDGVFQK